MPSASVPPPATSVLSASPEHDPDSWLRILSWCVIVLSLAQVLVFSFGRDQGIYGVVAEGIVQGQVPYRDLWDFKPPGIFFIYAGAFALFGKTMIAPRLVEVLMVFGAVLGLRRLGGVFFESRLAGLMGGAAYALVHAQLDFWHTGQPESFAGPLSVYALVLTTHHWPKSRQRYSWIGVGLLFGAAFVLKPPFGGGAVACAFYLSRKRRLSGQSWLAAYEPFCWVGLSSSIPILATCAWFALKGGWPALSWTLFEFAPGYTALSWVKRSFGSMFFHAMNEAFFGLSSLLAFGVLAALALHPRAKRELEGISLILGVLAFQIIGITVQGKFFQYHFGASLPLIGLIAGLGYQKLWQRAKPRSLAIVGAFALSLVGLACLHLPVNDTPHGFWERSVTRLRYLLSGGGSVSRAELDEKLHYVGGYNLFVARKVALELKRQVPPHAYTYIWGFEPVIYSLSQTRPSSRYIYNVPQRAKWQSDKARRILLADLAKHPPQAVITQRRDAMHFVTGNRFDSTDSLPNFPQLESWLHTHFKKVKTIDRFDMWLPVEQTSELPQSSIRNLQR